MTDAAYAARLGRTYLHTVTAYRPTADGEVLIYEEQPCALSRSAHTSAPAPSEGGILPESSYRLALYSFPAVCFQLGDRVEISDGAGRIYRGRTSDSFRYPSHCVTVIDILEVEG